MEEAIAAAQEAERPGSRSDKPPVAEQLAVTTGDHGEEAVPGPGYYPAQSEYTAGPNYATAYEPKGQPNPQR